jgi:hypothetical protein
MVELSYAPNVSRCYGCNACMDPSCSVALRDLQLDTKNKVITNLVRIPASLYANNLESVVASHDLVANLTDQKVPVTNRYYIGKPGGSQASDRARFSGSKLQFNRTVPSRGNSTKRSQTSMRPGSQAPGGIGVDVKHNSYQRYLLKKKGLYALQGQEPLGNHKKRIENNKYRKGEVIAGCKCIKK